MYKQEHPYRTVTSQPSANHQVWNHFPRRTRGQLLNSGRLVFHSKTLGTRCSCRRRPTPTTWRPWRRRSPGCGSLRWSTARSAQRGWKYAVQAAGGYPERWEHWPLLVYMCPLDVLLKKLNKICFSIYNLCFLWRPAPNSFIHCSTRPGIIVPDPTGTIVPTNNLCGPKGTIVPGIVLQKMYCPRQFSGKSNFVSQFIHNILTFYAKIFHTYGKIFCYTTL